MDDKVTKAAFRDFDNGFGCFVSTKKRYFWRRIVGPLASATPLQPTNSRGSEELYLELLKPCLPPTIIEVLKNESGNHCTEVTKNGTLRLWGQG